MLSPARTTVVSKRTVRILTFLFSSVALLCFALTIATHSISDVDLASFSLVRAMPIPFWIGLVALSFSTILSLTTRRFRIEYYTIAFVWVLFLFVTVELLEENARFVDTWGQLRGVILIQSGQDLNFWYKGWPGFSYLSTSISYTTGIPFPVLPKTISISLHVVRLLLVILFCRTLIKNERCAFLATLTMTSMLWVSQFHPCPENIAFLIYLVLLTTYFGKPGNITQKVLLVILFLALVITHGLTSLAVVAIVAVSELVSRRATRYEKRGGGRKRSLTCLFFLATFLAWFLYWATSYFNWAVHDLITYTLTGRSLHSMGAFASAGSVVRLQNLILRFVFLGLAFFWGSLLFGWSICHYGKRKSLESIAPLWYVFPIIILYFVVSYLSVEPDRIYLLAIPFLAWSLGDLFDLKDSSADQRLRHTRVNTPKPEHRIKGRSWWTIPLIAMLLMHFPIMYSNEFLDCIPTTETRGANFFVSFAPENASFFYWGQALSLGENNRGFTGEGVSISQIRIGDFPDTDFALDSHLEQNFYRYFLGNQAYALISDFYFRSESNLVYDNGEFKILSNLR